MRRISAWAAIFAIPTMVAGFYGMNFEHMPELRWSCGYPLALGLMALASGLLYRAFRRNGWLQASVTPGMPEPGRHMPQALAPAVRPTGGPGRRCGFGPKRRVRADRPGRLLALSLGPIHMCLAPGSARNWTVSA